MKKIALPKIHESNADNMRLLAVRTSTKDLVYLQGSLLGGENMLSLEKRAVAWLLVDLLDAGTRTQTKEEIRSAIATLGATLNFNSSGERIHFSASCLPEHVPVMVDIIVSCLTTSIFSEKELQLSKKRMVAEFTESKSKTRRVALCALGKDLYPKNHPNYPLSAEESISSIQGVTQAEVVSFFKTLGKKGLQFAIAGDINPKKSLADAKMRFQKLPNGNSSRAVLPSPKTASANKTLVPIADKTSIDMVVGVRAELKNDDPRFLAYRILLSMLGGSGISTGHLMRTVRERDGLTYGIRAFPSGFEEGFDGNMTIWATFAPSVFEKGVRTTYKEVNLFLTKGITQKLLTAKKEEMLGKYLLGLSTTLGMVSVLAELLRENREVSYLHDFPNLLERVSLQEIKEIRKLIPLNNLSLAAAGTFLK